MITQDSEATSKGATDSDMSPTVGDPPMREVHRTPSHGAAGPIDQEAHHPVELVTSNAASMVAPPPDGGFWAWMSVVSGFFAIMNTW